MRVGRFFWIGFVGCALLFAPAQALDSVSVELQDPAEFTDFALSDTGSEKEVRELAREWTEFVEAEAPKRIDAPGTLHLSFSDIDMAGDFEPWNSHNNPDIRFFRAVYPPRIRFSYRLLDASGAEVAAGQESLSDMGFELGRSPGYENELLYYEKSLMRGWFVDLNRKLKEAKD
jgi:hypothetical protein